MASAITALTVCVVSDLTHRGQPVSEIAAMLRRSGHRTRTVLAHEVGAMRCCDVLVIDAALPAMLRHIPKRRAPVVVIARGGGERTALLAELVAAQWHNAVARTIPLTPADLECAVRTVAAAGVEERTRSLWWCCGLAK